MKAQIVLLLTFLAGNNLSVAASEDGKPQRNLRQKMGKKGKNLVVLVLVLISQITTKE
jgi:hypothetical protein